MSSSIHLKNLAVYSHKYIARVLYNYLSRSHRKSSGEFAVKFKLTLIWLPFESFPLHLAHSSCHIGNANWSARQKCWPSCTRCGDKDRGGARARHWGPQIKSLIFWNKAAVITNWQQCMCPRGKRSRRGTISMCVWVCRGLCVFVAILWGNCACCRVVRLGSELWACVMASCGQSTRQYISQALPRFRFRTHTDTHAHTHTCIEYFCACVCVCVKCFVVAGSALIALWSKNLINPPPAYEWAAF